MAKKIDLSSIVIKKVIVHDIPQHKKKELTINPGYSEQESKLSDGLRLFFKDKVVQALSSDRSFKICFDSNNPSPVSEIAADMLATNCKDIVKSSKGIAKQLFDIQVGINAPGILVVIYGEVSDFNTCIILKLERDQGAQLTLDPKTQSYNIEEVKDLMLTQKTKIFKVALLISRNDFSTKFDGMVMDYQIDIKAKKEVVTFFIDKFLGCRAFQDPKITTQKFYNLTRAYIDTVDDVLDQAKYIQDLNSYMQKNTNTLNPKDFADDYLKTSAHKNQYKDYLEKNKFKFSTFIKDTNLIDAKLEKFAVQFDNGITIVGNKGTFKEKVKLTELTNGQHKAEITSKIKKLS
jgi:37-kD nucleoid-associated bacterial protein